MARMIFVNLPTKDLAISDTFYAGLGFEKNTDFSNEVASAWMITETIWVMVLTEEFYSSFLRNGDTPHLRRRPAGGAQRHQRGDPRRGR